MEDLEAAAARALDEARAISAEADQARVQVAAARAAVRELAQRLEAGWSSLFARGQALLDAADAGERELAAQQAPVEDALEQMHGAVVALVSAALDEGRLTRREYEELAARAEAIAPELAAAVASAEDAEAALQERLAELRTGLEQAAAEVEQELQVDLGGQLKAFEIEAERAAAQVVAALDECLMAVEDCGRELFDQLVRTEDDLRAALDAAAAGADAAAEQSQHACAEGHEDVLARLEHQAEALAAALSSLQAFVGRGHDELESAQERCQDAFRDTGQSLREARQAVRDLEEMLSRFSFVRL